MTSTISQPSTIPFDYSCDSHQLKIYISPSLHLSQVADIVDGYDLPGSSGPNKAVDSRGVLTDTPKMGVVQPDEGGNEHLIDGSVSRQENGCFRMPDNYLLHCR